MEAQHSLEWYRKRLGHVTGSRVGDLMKSGRKKEEKFGGTAISYMYQLVAERTMNPDIVNDDNAFEKYLMRVGISSKAIEWGNKREPEARNIYNRIKGCNMIETGFCLHPSIPFFGSSLDGFYCSDEGEKGVLEIKCPDQDTFMKYSTEVIDNAGLLLIKPEYFYQCQSHIMVTGAEWCDFVVYCPFQSIPIHIVRILPDYMTFKLIEKRISMVNKWIDNVMDLWKKRLTK